MTDITVDKATIALALEAIELNWRTDEGDAVTPILRAALAEPAPVQEQQFTADELDLMRQWFESMQDTNRSFVIDADKKLHQKIIAAIQAAPRAEQPRKAVKLSDSEIASDASRHWSEDGVDPIAFAHAIESAVWAKNGWAE